MRNCMLRSKYGVLSRCRQPERLVAREERQRLVSLIFQFLSSSLFWQVRINGWLHYLLPTSVFLPPALSSTLCLPWWMNLRFCRRSKFDSQPLYGRAAFKDVTDDISSVLKWNKHVGGQCCTSHLISRLQTFHMEAGPHVAFGFEYKPRSVPESGSEQWWHSA